MPEHGKPLIGADKVETSFCTEVCLLCGFWIHTGLCSSTCSKDSNFDRPPGTSAIATYRLVGVKPITRKVERS